MMIEKEDIDLWMSKISECEILVVQMETNVESVMYAIKRAKEAGLTTIVNPAPYHDFNKKTLCYVDYFIPNEHELDDFAGKDGDIYSKAKKALEYGAKNVIVTLGEEGSILINEKDTITVDAHKVDAVDTTGAGDSYIGAFVASLLKGKSVKEAMEFASLCSSYTVRKKGAIVSLPKLADLS